jgi:hypothetical protein
VKEGERGGTLGSPAVKPGLYQLSYRHRGGHRIAPAPHESFLAVHAARPGAGGRFTRPEARPQKARIGYTSRRSRYAASRVSGNEMTKKTTITAP